MAGGLPLGLDVCNGQSVGSVASTSNGTALTTGAANTKGAYAQLVASTPSDCVFAIFDALGFGLGGQPSLGSVDFAIGASGSEKIIVADLEISSTAGSGAHSSIALPIQIPAGTRIAARGQSTGATDTLNASVILFDGSFTQMEGTAGVDALGFNSATGGGVLVDPGATLNTKGAYSQIIASTSRDYMGIFFILDVGNETTDNFVAWLVDIAIGGAGSENVIVPNFQALQAGGAFTGAGFFGWVSHFIPIAIKSGTRIAARAQANDTAAADREFGLTVYGVYQ